MKAKSSTPPTPVVAYPALVGQILAHHREFRNIKQGELAAFLSMSQSAYSRLESGDSVLNLTQLRNIAERLGVQPSAVLTLAEQYEAQLRRQGVQIVAEKQDNSAAIVIGLALLAALLMSR